MPSGYHGYHIIYTVVFFLELLFPQAEHLVRSHRFPGSTASASHSVSHSVNLSAHPRGSAAWQHWCGQNCFILSPCLLCSKYLLLLHVDFCVEQHTESADAHVCVCVCIPSTTQETTKHSHGSAILHPRTVHDPSLHTAPLPSGVFRYLVSQTSVCSRQWCM